ncbi:MAG: (Fe-S)-binding protein [Chloroflexi bacterium]|nr:(Fe-S)-binding protein [Chloroflexota bacterium]
MDTTVLRSPGRSFSEVFYETLHQGPKGERIRNCLQCGMCSGVCPFGNVMDYTPSRMIAALRSEVFERVMSTDTVWMCVSCYACTEACPAAIPLTSNLMTRVKEELLLAGKVPAELQIALENSQRYGNVLGLSARKRADWTKGILARVPVMGKDKKAAQVLWFVGDYASYHPRVQATSRAFASILNALGIDFAILGPDEVSDGDSQRLAGERGLFEMLAAKNGQGLSKYSFDEIVTTDPHAYNALKNEYPALGVAYPVKHYTQFLAERLADLKPLLKRRLEGKVTFHDPCYLGRANGVYDEPRALLGALPGAELVEMAHNRKTSLCCGGGGGGMWLEGFHWEKAHARTSEWRVQEAITSGADTLAVACPYETPRFEDATKTVRAAAGLVVKDIAELLVDAMD